MKTMYFGSRERMAWVPCPKIDVDLSKTGWSTSGKYLNGGSYVRRSATGAKSYTFSWNLASAEDIHKVLDYADGVYGSGPFYFLEPFAQDTNLFPQYWASPRLATLDAPSLIRDKRPTLSPGVPSLDYPAPSTNYTLADGDTFRQLDIPVPPGYALHVGIHGFSTGTAAVVVGAGESPAVPMTLLSKTTTVRTNYIVSGDDAGWAHITLSGVGQLSLYGMIAQIRPIGDTVPEGGFISGRGHSGCEFDGFPSVNGYSAALDKQGATALLTEVAAWL